MSYEFYHNTLTVPASVLIEEEILSYDNYKKLCARGKLRRARDGKGLGNYALIEFETLSDKIKVEVVKKCGYPPKKQEQHEILKYRQTDYEAIDFFATYEIDDNRSLSPEHQEQYITDAEMLQAVDKFVKNTHAFRKSRGVSKITEVWEMAAQAMKELKEQTGHKLPGTAKRLKEKVEDFGANGYKSLISEKFLGQNASKITTDEQTAILRQLMRQYQNFDDEHISKSYNQIALTLGYPSISAGTVANYRKKFALTVKSFAEGKKEFNKTYKMQVKRRAPQFPMAYWTLDGWNAELLYQKFENGKTTYHNRLTIVVVLDPSTKYPVGYAIGERENSELIKAAIRNAVCHTEELFGFKHKVFQIQADNYASKIMAPIYRAVAKNYIPTTVGNAQAKVIEPWFNFFNKTYCRTESNWSGFGIKSRNQPNPDFLSGNKKNIPTQEQAYQQLERLIEKARADVQQEFLTAYESAPDDLKTLLSEFEYYKHLGVKKPKTNKLSGLGIKFDVNKIGYNYDSFDPNFRRHAHLDWEIYFTPENMQKVLAFNPMMNISFMLEEKWEQPMDLYSQQQQDKDELLKIQRFNSYQIGDIMKKYAEDVEIINDLQNDTAQIETLEKLMISDSKGQNKDQKTASVRKSEKVLQKQEKALQNATEKDWSQTQDEYLKNKIDLNKYNFENE